MCRDLTPAEREAAAKAAEKAAADLAAAQIRKIDKNTDKK